ncbi:MAG: N-formylglutamate amidohydrolase [Hyphomicrobiaceae bacterium]|nr:N-formylglutamate amidohydrolase [Hyphomicrobiaceae bacterium]
MSVTIQESFHPGVLHRRTPASDAVPLVFDIPRSGSDYPREFQSPAPFDAVRRSVSMYVEELYASAPDHGATWLYAMFPNTYIDANRHELDVDPEWLEGDWNEPLETSDKSVRGMGLIPRVCGKGDVVLQDTPITAADLRHRLDAYYWPYHNTLTEILNRFREQHGAAFHISCHSMSSIGGKAVADAGRKRSDFDIGTRNGTTTAPAFADIVVETLKGFGYDTTQDEHFIGAESVRKHGNPDAGVHSLQIEINRSIYMDEDTYRRGERFATIQEHLSQLIARLAEFTREWL